MESEYEKNAYSSRSQPYPRRIKAEPYLVMEKSTGEDFK